MESSGTYIIDKKTALFAAIVSGVFLLTMAVGVSWYALAFRHPAYFDDETFIKPRESLKSEPDQPQLIERFRKDDRLRREKFLTAQRKVQVGAYLLFGALFVFVLSLKRYMHFLEKPPQPLGPRRAGDEAGERNRAAGAALGISALLSVAGFVAMHALLPDVSGTEPEKPKGIVIAGAKDEPVPEHLQWPHFRGPTRMGIVKEMALPLSWNAAKNENILWKTKVPLAGNSSPIVWGRRLFLTGADRRKRQVYCYDRTNGRLEWTCTVRSQAVLGKDFEIYEDTGLAAPTCATDGKKVFALFGTGEFVAVNFDGTQRWSRWLGEPDSIYGLASSPLYHDGRLILQLDQGGADEGKSFLYAFDPANGNSIWKKPRKVPNSWSSPVVVHTGGREEIITCANPWVISYEAKTGRELWRVKALDGDVAPLPVYADGMVYAETDYAELVAIRVGGSGDVTKTHIAWKYDEELSETSSPLCDGKYFLHATGDGTIACLDAKTGTAVWRKKYEKGFWSSPALVGRRVYLTDMSGTTYIFELGDSYRLLGTGIIGEEVVTTPAFVDSKIYVRGKDHLYCIGAEEQ